MLLHGEAVQHVTDEGSEILTPTEVIITSGALDLCTKVAQDAMIPIECAFLLFILCNVNQSCDCY